MKKGQYEFQVSGQVRTWTEYPTELRVKIANV
jgi:hypothetical protein